MLNYYTGYKPGDTPGNLPPPYYWWEAGAMFSSLVDYWYYTGDTQFNDITTQALLHQVGPNNDYMPPNQTMTEVSDRRRSHQPSRGPQLYSYDDGSS